MDQDKAREYYEVSNELQNLRYRLDEMYGGLADEFPLCCDFREEYCGLGLRGAISEMAELIKEMGDNLSALNFDKDEGSISQIKFM